MQSLSEWLKAKNITAAEFGRQIGVSRASISRLLSGKRAPTADLVDKVEQGTGGDVTPNDMFSAWRATRDGRAVTPGAPTVEKAPAQAAAK